jgi:hypothetical protein
MNANADIEKRRRSRRYSADGSGLSLFQLHGWSHILVPRYPKSKNYGPNGFILIG